MKSPYLVPAATAIIGFSIAWLAKPDPAPAKGSTAPATAENAPQRPARDGGRTPVSTGKRPAEVKAGDFPLADQAEKGPQTKEEAKMLRLAEALGLTVEQQGAVISLVEGVQATASDQVSVIEDLTSRGKAIEDGLKAILTPEQWVKFQELRDRERENRNEVRAQVTLKNVLVDIDISPDQREEILGRLRQKAKADLQSIPASATLLLDNSMLPIGNKELSADGVLLLAQIGQEVLHSNPLTAQQKVLDQQRAELERLLECFDGILTPAQMGQYQAALAEQKSILKGLRNDPSKQRHIPYAGEPANPNRDLEKR